MFDLECRQIGFRGCGGLLLLRQLGGALVDFAEGGQDLIFKCRRLGLFVTDLVFERFHLLGVGRFIELALILGSLLNRGLERHFFLVRRDLEFFERLLCFLVGNLDLLGLGSVGFENDRGAIQFLLHFAGMAAQPMNLAQDIGHTGHTKPPSRRMNHRGH